MTSSSFLRIIPFNCLSAVTFVISLTINIYPLPTTAGSADDYLNELEVEAQRSANVRKTDKDKPTDDPALKKYETFSKILKFERPMTFRFFLKLDKQQQQTIAENFTKHKKISRASKKIFDLYFSKK